MLKAGIQSGFVCFGMFYYIHIATHLIEATKEALNTNLYLQRSYGRHLLFLLYCSSYEERKLIFMTKWLSRRRNFNVNRFKTFPNDTFWNDNLLHSRTMEVVNTCTKIHSYLYHKFNVLRRAVKFSGNLISRRIWCQRKDETKEKWMNVAI